MGRPRLILLVRHAQSEGNKNREIHQFVPDHRVKLTEDGWVQAEEAGRQLRSLLRPDDTLQFFTSPYRRTRETTEGILRTLTTPDEHGAASPFSRDVIKIFEEPRLREQDFGNFQPCSAEMQRMWQERADYGHFFYRIPNGESAADAYDRVAGFNESLWRQFNEPDFPSVCVLVTHGLMTRVFLMKWYHWSVEYFEDLRNINHCEFIVMEKDAESGKYALQNKLRTWSELKREKLIEAEEHSTRIELKNLQRRNTLSQFLPSRPKISPSPPPTKWGGCVGGCQHDHQQFPRRQLQSEGLSLSPSAAHARKPNGSEAIKTPATPEGRRTPARAIPSYLTPGRDGGGSDTPHEDDHKGDDYFSNESQSPKHKVTPQRRPTVEDFERWADESGMGKGVKADALGDEPDEAESIEAKVETDLGNEMAYENSVRESVY